MPIYLSIRVERAGKVLTVPSLLLKRIANDQVEFYCTMADGGAFGMVAKWYPLLVGYWGRSGNWFAANPVYRIIYVKKLPRAEYLARLERMHPPANPGKGV